MIRDRPRRRNSNRAEGYDYATPGSYFVTICTHRLQPMFGEVVDGEMIVNAAGQMADDTWHDLPNRFPFIELDAFVIMPNHLHGIVVIHEDPAEWDETIVRAQFIAPCPHESQTPDLRSNAAGPRQGAINCARTNPKTLGNIVRVFKAVTTDRIRRSGMVDFRWHRNYYDHIIRNDRDMDRVREYILNNPLNWQHDRANREEIPIP